MIKIHKSIGLFFKVLEIASSRLFKIQRIQNLPGDVKRLYWGAGGGGNLCETKSLNKSQSYTTVHVAKRNQILNGKKKVGFEVLRLNLNSKLSGYVTFRQVAKTPEI